MTKRHKHNLNHYRLMSGRFGELLPTSCMEMLPGDTFRKRSKGLVRLSPMISPVMHPIQFRIHTFFVPMRLLWDQWEEFIVDLNTDLTIPTFQGTVIEGDIHDYLGVPPGEYELNPISNLPRRAYNLIWNEFFRDQAIDDERVINLDEIAHVRWEKDYFSIARTEAQQGDPVKVGIEFDQDVPIQGIGNDDANPGVFGPHTIREFGGFARSGQFANFGDNIDGSHVLIEEDPDNAGFPNIRIAQGAVSGALDINEWRRGMAFQKISEHRNKFGSRYTDYLRFLGVRSSDARLQRPEYLGGGSSQFSISEVLSTADTVDTQGPDNGQTLGALAGHGIAGAQTGATTYFAEEHGYMMTLASIRPKVMYSTALNKTFYRQKPEDFWQKELEMMGDQPILNGELYAQATQPRDIFGYGDRHQEYRTHPSGVSGEMRELLNFWHLAREFTQTPQLNSSFLECNPTERIFADSNTDTFQLKVNHQVTARRLVSKFARN